MVGVAEEHEGRGYGPHLGDLGTEAGHRLLGLGRGREPYRGGHAGHQGTPCGATALRLKLSPVECFFRELRRAVEGRVYPTLQAKQEALEPILDVTQFESPLV